MYSDRDEVLALASREAAEQLTFPLALRIAADAAARMPRTESKVTRTNSNTTTLQWQRGCAPWQRPNWG
jgi:hypothetical protein